MALYDEEIGPDPEILRYDSVPTLSYHHRDRPKVDPVGRYKRSANTDGLPRYKPHASRAILSKKEKEITSEKIDLAIVVWFIVLIVIIVLVIFTNRKLLNSKYGFLAAAVSVLFIISVVAWYLSCNSRPSFAFMIVLVILLVVWWILVEFFDFDHIPDVAAAAGIIISLAAYWYHGSVWMILPLLSFLILLWISNFGLKEDHLDDFY